MRNSSPLKELSELFKQRKNEQKESELEDKESPIFGFKNKEVKVQK